jgi:hypothetical protein
MATGAYEEPATSIFSVTGSHTGKTWDKYKEGSAETGAVIVKGLFCQRERKDKKLKGKTVTSTG